MPSEAVIKFPLLILILIIALSIGWGVSWPMMKIALREFPDLDVSRMVMPRGGDVSAGIGAAFRRDDAAARG